MGAMGSSLSLKELDAWSARLDNEDKGRPAGILILSSCSARFPPRDGERHGEYGLLRKARELFKENNQIVLAGEASDDFHEWLKPKLELSDKIWKAAYLGKLEGCLRIKAPLAHQLVTVHGGSRCNWERQVLEEQETKNRYCTSSDVGQVPVLHFRNYDKLNEYVNEHVLYEYTVRIHYRVSSGNGSDGSEEWMGVMSWQQTAESISQYLSHKARSVMRIPITFSTFSWRASAHFVAMGYLDPPSMHPPQEASDVPDAWAAMAYLDDFCRRELPRSIESSIQAATGTLCECRLQELAVVSSRFAAISRKLDTMQKVPSLQFTHALDLFLTEEDGIVLIPKLLQLCLYGNSVQKALASKYLAWGMESIWKDRRLPDERLHQWVMDSPSAAPVSYQTGKSGGYGSGSQDDKELLQPCEQLAWEDDLQQELEYPPGVNKALYQKVAGQRAKDKALQERSLPGGASASSDTTGRPSAMEDLSNLSPDQKRSEDSTETKAAHQEADAVSAGITTVRMRNIPSEISREMLINLLNAHGFKCSYDLVYLPMHYEAKISLGYSFINFISPEAASRFRETFQFFCDWGVQTDKVCEVSWSTALQGVDAHIERYRNCPVMHEVVPDAFKPVLFKNGERVPFPAPTMSIRPPRLRKARTLGGENVFDNKPKERKKEKGS